MSSTIGQTIQRRTGAYYTPASLAGYLANWLIRTGTETILEPSFGDGVFIDAIRSLARSQNFGADLHVTGVEIDPTACQLATLDKQRKPDRIICGDFLDTALPPVDAVIANPPFVRLRHLPTSQRDRAAAVATKAIRVVTDSKASLWLPFLARATTLLKPGGRLAFVLPVEATFVNYGLALWRHLAATFSSLTVVRVRERVFDDLSQDVVLLLADRHGGSTREIRFLAYETMSDLSLHQPTRDTLIEVDAVLTGQRPFTRALLPYATDQLLLSLEARGLMSPAKDSIKFNIGYVAGDKDFFHPTTATVDKFGLPNSSLKKSVVSARSLSGCGLQLSDKPAVDRLFYPSTSLTSGDRDYISSGEQMGVANRYKCRVRRPWYMVPDVRRPDVVLSVFGDRPIMRINDIEASASNSFLCGTLSPKFDARSLLAAWYTPLTLIGLELAIHSLGGGVMVAVPAEVASTRIPRPDLIPTDQLGAVDAALKAQQPNDAYFQGSAALRVLGLSKIEIEAVVTGAETLANWRRRPPTVARQVPHLFEL